MSRRKFHTVPEELLECAEQAARFFSSRGYAVSIEKKELGFPYTPTILCTRQHTKIIVEVVSKIDLARLKQWVAFAKSTGQDSRVAVAIPEREALRKGEDGKLQQLEIGCYVKTNGGFKEYLVPADLALGVTLPDLSTLPRRVRELFGPAYEQFDRSQWREGFEDACQAFEQECRRYLKRHTKNGRIKVLTSKGPRTLKRSTIERMSMGPLAKTFGNIASPNHTDSLIYNTLIATNKDRINVAHHKRKKRTESRLRQNVGRHMWTLVSATKAATS